VHEGFLASYLNIRAQITEAIGANLSSRNIHIAGHSLGAAFAVFAACDIELSMKRRVSSLYTYGSPRVGDDLFVQAFNGAFARKTFRIANSSDLVTELPFPVPFAGVFGGYFSHVDTPVLCTVQNNDIEENHAMATYVAVLRDYERKNSLSARLFGRYKSS
jgi:triacylglycerol lipase